MLGKFSLFFTWSAQTLSKLTGSATKYNVIMRIKDIGNIINPISKKVLLGSLKSFHISQPRCVFLEQLSISCPNYYKLLIKKAPELHIPRLE